MLPSSRRRSRVGLGLAMALAGGLGIAACDAILVGGLKIGVCNEGQTRCASGNTLQTCDGSGQWNSGAPCAGQTCNPVSGRCEGECAPGSKRCGGSTPEQCDTAGQWSAGLPCDVDAGNQHCSGGACVVTCTPGDLQCTGDLPQRCNPSGDWVDDGTACPPCTGCDPGTGKCRTSPFPDDSPCQPPGDMCILRATCQNNQCIPAPDGGQVECVAAGPCSPGACDLRTGTCAAMEGTSCDDGDVCTPSSTCQGGVCAGTPASDHTWAHWDPHLGPDASAPSPRYVWTDDVVHDSVSGLTWQRVVPTTSAYSRADAKLYCACLLGAGSPCKILGYPSGWRLPTRIELLSIVDFTQVHPSIDLVAFPGTKSEVYWSSSVFGNGLVRAWGVNFDEGTTYSGFATNTLRVRCVR